MKSLSEYLRALGAAIVTVIVSLAALVGITWVVMTAVSAVVPATTFGVVVMLLASYFIFEVVFAKIDIEPVMTVVANVIFWLFGTSYEMWDSDDIKTVHPKASPDAEPQAT